MSKSSKHRSNPKKQSGKHRAGTSCRRHTATNPGQSLSIRRQERAKVQIFGLYGFAERLTAKQASDRSWVEENWGVAVYASSPVHLPLGSWLESGLKGEVMAPLLVATDDLRYQSRLDVSLPNDDEGALIVANVLAMTAPTEAHAAKARRWVDEMTSRLDAATANRCHQAATAKAAILGKASPLGRSNL
jgi:hypothetical protein